jgi:hypothetical protein
VKAIALTCARCSGRLLVAPGVSLGICNVCAAAYDFSTGEKRELPVLEPAAGPSEGPARAVRLPFLRFEAAGAGASRPIYVMGFAVTRIGSPLDDGAKLTTDGLDRELRAGRVDVPPELPVATAAALARFSALRKLDPDARAGLRPAGVGLSAPCVLAVPFAERAGRLFNPFTGMAVERAAIRVGAA